MCVTTVQIIDEKPDLNNSETQNNATPKKASWVINCIELTMLALVLAMGITYIIVCTSTGVNALDILVNQRKDEAKQNMLWGAVLIIAIAIIGAITTFLVAVVREKLTTSPTHDVQSILKMLFLFKTCDLLILVADLVAIVIAYPYTEIREIFIFFTTPLVAMGAFVEMTEMSYKREIGIKEENMLFNQPDMAFYEKDYALI